MKYKVIAFLSGNPKLLGFAEDATTARKCLLDDCCLSFVKGEGKVWLKVSDFEDANEWNKPIKIPQIGPLHIPPASLPTPGTSSEAGTIPEGVPQ